jgi:hypothetical protein
MGAKFVLMRAAQYRHRFPDRLRERGGSMDEELRTAIDNLQRAFQKSGLKGMRIGFGPDGTIIETFAANEEKRDSPMCNTTPSSPSGTDGATNVRDIAKRLTDRRNCGHDPWQCHDRTGFIRPQTKRRTRNRMRLPALCA